MLTRGREKERKKMKKNIFNNVLNWRRTLFFIRIIVDYHFKEKEEK